MNRRYDTGMFPPRLALTVVATSCLSLVAIAACVGEDPDPSSSNPDGGASSSGGSSGASGGSSGGSSGAGPCTPTSCGPHGTCENQACKCEPGYEGATCAACAEGFQDKDTNGTCEPGCGTSACGPHMTCDDATGKVVCACAVGYSGSGTCTWGGGLLDPTFQNTPANAWTADRGAVVDPTAAGSQEPGWAHFSEAASCDTGGRVVQTITMPPYTQAEPFALKMNGRLTCLGISCGGQVQGAAVSLNAASHRVSVGSSFAFQELCLGERAYGGPLRVAIQPLDIGCAGNDHEFQLYVDRAEIVPQTQCPALGQIRNANFEGLDGWTPQMNGTSTAGIVDGAGANGTRGGRLTTTMQCERPSLANNVSVPAASVPNTALKVTYKSSALALTDVLLNGVFIGQLQPKTAVGTSMLCVPEWAKGGVHELKLMLQSEGQNACASAFSRSVDIDELSWASDTTCAADAKVLDPGVERVDTASAWRLMESVQFGAGVDKISDNTKARSGSGAIRLEGFKACGDAYAATSITIPPAAGANGPAVKFHYTRTSNANATFRASVAGASTTLTAAATYTQSTLCLDPKRVGQAETLTFRVNVFGNCTNASFTMEQAFFDDVEVTTDASCAAQ